MSQHTIPLTIPWARLLVFGAPGEGKTFSSSLAEDVCVVALERQGLGSIYAANPAASVTTVGPSDQEWTSLWQKLPSIAAGCRTLVLDSLTRTHERNLRVVSAKRLGGRAAEKKDTLAAKAHEKVIFENKLDLTEQDYGRAHRWTLRQLEILEDLPCHVVVIAHSRLTRSGSSTKVAPYLGAQKINDSFHLHRRFSAVGLLHRGHSGERHCYWTSGDVSINGKIAVVCGKEHALLPSTTPADARVWLAGFEGLIRTMESPHEVASNC